MATYLVKLVDFYGNVAADLGGSSVSRIQPLVQTLAPSVSWGWSMHNLDPKALDVQPLIREAQLWRDGSYVADSWAAVVAPSAEWGAERDEFDVRCAGLPWYFGKRLFGKADRTNYLTTPDFEGGLAPWIATGVTAVASSTRKKTGAQSAKLTQATAGVDTYLGQGVSITGGGVGALVTVAAWYYIDAAGWVGPALDKRGLFLQRRTGATVHEYTFAPIDDDTPRGVWLREETTVHVPANVTQTVDVRLYGPGTTGGIFWDSVSLTVMESLSYYATDQASIASGIVIHAQAPAYAKSDLAIGWTVGTTGVLRDRHYQFAEHGEIAGALREFTDLDNGFDWHIATTSTTRNLAIGYPRRGTARAALTVAECSRLRYSFDGDAAISSLTVLGEGDGPDREEGGAVDNTVFGGLILEDVIQAPTGADVDTLDSRANEELRVRKNPKQLEVTLAPGLRIGSLFPGDTLTGPADHGALKCSGSWRVISTSLDPSTDQLSFAANPA